MKLHHLLAMALGSIACADGAVGYGDETGGQIGSCDDTCFEPRHEAYSSHNITDISVIDFDDDGVDDLLVAHEHSPITLLRGGVSGLSVEGQVHVGAGQIAVEPVDMDGDGVMDIVVLDEHMDVTLMRGDGAGGFSVFSPPTPTIYFGTAEQIDSGDLTGDGRPDIVLLFEDTVVIFIENDHSHLTFPIVYDVPGAGKSLSVVDVDGVNGPDIVVGSYDDTHVSVLTNLGSGTFEIHVIGATLQADNLCTEAQAVSYNINNHILMTAPLDDAFEYIVTGDFDGDGNDDTVVSTSSEVYAHYSRPCD